MFSTCWIDFCTTEPVVVDRGLNGMRIIKALSGTFMKRKASVLFSEWPYILASAMGVIVVMRTLRGQWLAVFLGCAAVSFSNVLTGSSRIVAFLLLLFPFIR